MAIPLIGAAGAGLMKLGAMLKGGTALKAAAGFAPQISKGVATAAKVGGMPGTGAAAKLASGTSKAAEMAARAKAAGVTAAKDKVRYAGLNMTDSAGFLERIKRGLTSVEGFKTNYGRPMGADLGMALAPDLLFGGLTAAMTPGDLGDKALAGAGTAIGGASGGLVARGVLGPRSDMGRMMAELGGGIAGDMAGMKVSEALMRAKNGGTTPYEQQANVDMEELRQQIIADYIRNGQ